MNYLSALSILYIRSPRNIVLDYDILISHCYQSFEMPFTHLWTAVPFILLDWDGIREIVALVDTFLVVVGNPKGNGGVGDEGVTNSIGFGDSSTVSEDESRLRMEWCSRFCIPGSTITTLPRKVDCRTGDELRGKFISELDIGLNGLCVLFLDEKWSLSSLLYRFQFDLIWSLIEVARLVWNQ